MGDNSVSVSWPRFLAGSGVFLVLTFTMLGPDISGDLKGGRLLLFWTAHVFGALVILQSVQMLLMRVQSISGLSPWLQVLVSGVIGAVLFTPFAGVLDQMFGMEDLADDPTETLTDMLIGEFTGLAGLVTLVWVGLNATRLVQTRPLTPQRATDLTAKAPAFWDRVPAKLGRDLVAVSAELHYIRIYTTQGDALILFSFGQAVAQLAHAVAGMQIHRSHWACLSHIDKVTRKGQAGACHMRSGLTLPVSRRYMQDLKTHLGTES